MHRKYLLAFQGALLAASIGGSAEVGAINPPGPPPPQPPTVPTVPTIPDLPAIQDPSSILPAVPTPPPPTIPSIPPPQPPNPPPPTIPTVPDPGSVVAPSNLVQGPKVYDSYKVMCEQSGLRFNLDGGLLYLDPDTLQITTVAEAALRTLSPLGPVAVDIPDRYQAANCSQDGGRTWGKVILDFYVPNYGETSILHTGYEDAVLGDQSSPSAQEYPVEQETDINAFFQAMQGLLGEAPGPESLGTPQLPTLPSPLYTIDVTYKGPAGQYITTSSPGVVGAPSAVAIVNGNGNQPETLVVEIAPSETPAGTDGTGESSGFALKVQRIVTPNVTATCSPLEADVTVRLAVANPQDPGYPSNATGSVEFGYRTIGVTPRATAPSTFELKYESSTASVGPTRSDFLVALKEVPSCTTDALKVVGHYVDRADPVRSDDDVDLTLELVQPVMTDWTLRRKTDPSYKMMVTSTSPKPLGTMRIRGQNKSKQMDASLNTIPENVSACFHNGNLCNAPWRLDRASEVSFRFEARDSASKAAPLSVHYGESQAGESLDLLLTLSDLRIDAYVGQFGFKELPGVPFVKGSYPKWFFIDTGGNPITGYYHSTSGRHHLNIDMGGSNRFWGREVVADKKKWGTKIKVDMWGSIACSGLSIDMDGVPAPINGRLLGAALCF